MNELQALQQANAHLRADLAVSQAGKDQIEEVVECARELAIASWPELSFLQRVRVSIRMSQMTGRVRWWQ